MSDRIKGFTVILENDMKDEDAEHIAVALASIRGVLEARPVLTSPIDVFTRAQVKHELIQKLFEVLR